MSDYATGSSTPPSQISALYRKRARYALSLARRAKRQGNLDAALGLADEALLWRAYATDWQRRALTYSL